MEKPTAPPHDNAFLAPRFRRVYGLVRPREQARRIEWLGARTRDDDPNTRAEVAAAVLFRKLPNPLNDALAGLPGRRCARADH